MKIKANKITMVDIKDLEENPKNNNDHPPKQIERLMKIIEFQGFRNPLTVSTRSGYVLCGHGRIEAARNLGFKELPVIYQDFASEEEEYAHMTADNEIARWSSLDMGKVNEEVANWGPDLPFEIDMLGPKSFEPLVEDKLSQGGGGPSEVECPNCGEVFESGKHKA